MIVQLLIGALLAVLSIDRFHKIISLIPWLFDYLYFLLFPKKNSENTGKKLEPDESYLSEGENCKQVPENIDDSLTKLMETIYTSYIDPISDLLNLSQDVHITFRYMVRHFFADLCYRLSKVDCKRLILNFIPKITRHLNACKKGFETTSSNDDREVLLNAYSSTQIHSAICSEGQDDHYYFQNLFESILNISLTENQRKSRILILLIRSALTFYVFKPLIEYLSNASNIHYLLMQIRHFESPDFQETASKYVILFRSFTVKPLKYPVVLTPPKNFMLSWQHLQSNPSLLYIFMQDLKNDKRFIYPHFCLTIDEWNLKISKLDTLNPRCKENHIKTLLSEAHKLYNVFISPNTYNRIKLPNDIFDKIQEFDFADISEQNLIKIQFLYCIIYKIAYEVLTNDCLDYFYRSSRFFMLCFGERPRLKSDLAQFHISQSRRDFMAHSSNFERSSVDYLSLKTNSTARSATTSDDDVSLDCASVESSCTEQPSNFDLSKLSVRITDLRTTIKKNSKILSFIITVSSPPTKDHDVLVWEVARQYKEFYGLENKLKRFHGDRINHYLPTKRSILLYKNHEFLKNCRKPFKEFLDSLLSNQYLKYSSMLYAFLTQDTQIDSNSFFPKALTTYTGRAIQSVISTLSVEKGKYIETFINSFAVSPDYTKPKVPPKASLSKLKKKLSFLKAKYSSHSFVGKLHWTKSDNSPIDLLHEILKTFVFVIQPRNLIRTTIYFFYTLFGGISELFFRRWISDQVDVLCSSTFLSNVISSVNTYLVSGSDQQQQDVTDKDFIDDIYQIIPHYFLVLVGDENVRISLKSCLQLISNRNLNKHLIYTFLDDLFSSAYPELIESKSVNLITQTSTID